MGKARSTTGPSCQTGSVQHRQQRTVGAAVAAADKELQQLPLLQAVLKQRLEQSKHPQQTRRPGMLLQKAAVEGLLAVLPVPVMRMWWPG